MMYKHNYNRDQVIIVDWDDTIIPSTFIDRWKIETYRDLPLHVSDLPSVWADGASGRWRESRQQRVPFKPLARPGNLGHLCGDFVSSSLEP
jgi:hypothetical protein